MAKEKTFAGIPVEQLRAAAAKMDEKLPEPKRAETEGVKKAREAAEATIKDYTKFVEKPGLAGPAIGILRETLPNMHVHDIDELTVGGIYPEDTVPKRIKNHRVVTDTELERMYGSIDRKFKGSMSAIRTNQKIQPDFKPETKGEDMVSLIEGGINDAFPNMESRSIGWDRKLPGSYVGLSRR